MTCVNAKVQSTKFVIMVYLCCVAGCGNDSRHPENYKKRSHVQVVKFHHFPQDEEKRKLWLDQVSRGYENYVPSKNPVVCSNHFPYGKPMFSSPVPTLFMTVRTASDPSPRKRRKILYPIAENTPKDSENNIFSKSSQCSFSFNSALIISFLEFVLSNIISLKSFFR